MSAVAARASQVPLRVETLRDVPEPDLEPVVASFRRDGAVEVRTMRQANSLWTIEATFRVVPA